MKLELVSDPLCPFVHRAAILLREKGVAYDIRYVDLAAKPDWFLALSPRGKVPVLVADGVVLFESSVIVEFLDETHPPHLVPSDPFERARQRAWVEVASDLFLAQYRLTTAASPGDVETHRRSYDAILARFEEELRGDSFAGDAFGLVDVAAAPVLFRTVLIERAWGRRLFQGFPKVERWARAIADRPSVTGSVLPDFERRYTTFLAGKGGLLARAETAQAAG